MFSRSAIPPSGTTLAPWSRKKTSAGNGLVTDGRSLMKSSRRRRTSAYSVLCVALFGLCAAAAASPDDNPPWAGEERIEVELRTVPFYVVDASGQPILDLKPTDVVLEVDGVALPFDVFERFGQGAAPPASTAARPVAEPAALAAGEGAAISTSEGRKVVLVCDIAFLSAGALVRSQEILARYLETLPGSDQLYLMVNDPHKGLRQDVGPVSANVAGKAELARAVARLKTDPSVNFDPSRGIDLVRGPGRNGVPSEQIHADLEVMRAGAVQQRYAMAETLADNTRQLAAFMTSLSGSKLLVMLTPGLDRTVFFEGSDGLMMQSSGLHHVKTRHTPALVSSFEAPLSALENSGALTVFVNPEAAENDGRESLAHMRERTGGVLLEGTDPRQLAARLASGTSAYYELGFYASQLPAGVKQGRLEIKVRREGVRVYTPARLSTRNTNLAMGALGKRFWVVDLVRNGLERAEAQRLAGQSFHDLPGRAAGRAVSSGRQLMFEPDWSALGNPADFEVFDVILAVTPGETAAEIERFEASSLAELGQGKQLVAPLPSGGSKVWGVVAVNPATGTTWMRRFLLEAPASQATVAKAVPKATEGRP